MERTTGKVYLVGAGPGDPGLITVKALECIRRADVLVYDRLVNERILDDSRPDAERIYVGKASSSHTMNQKDINRLLVSKAKENKVVVRLKGGDPLVFGRGGEEAEELASEGIPFEFVPGVTAAIAVPEYAGIPVSHRGLASSFAVITGHEDPTKMESSISWDKLATGVDTLIFLMGMENLPQLVQQLVANGRSPSTPIALVRNGTGPDQETLVGTVANISELAAERKFAPPVVIIVGEVVSLRDKLQWFENRPLLGRRVLVTRSRSQASKLTSLLLEQGANPIELPTIEIEPLPVSEELRKALGDLSRYDWVIFTSTNGVEVFCQRLVEAGLRIDQLEKTRICAIGPATAEACQRHGLTIDYTPEKFISESILEGLVHRVSRGTHVLLPRAQGARPVLVTGLESLGAEVDEIGIYRAVRPVQAAATGLRALRKAEIDVATFTSSSTVVSLVQLLDDDVSLINNTVIACIGPVTAATARDLGLRVDIVAEEHTIPGLVRALTQYFAAKG